MKLVHRTVPTAIFTVRGGMCPVASIVSLPPGTHPTSPIRNELHAIHVTATNGGGRWFGVAEAWIGSDLRMHVRVDPASLPMSEWPRARVAR